MAVSLHGNNGLVTTNGTAAAPSLAAPDTDTGLYFGTNLIHATTDGTERLRIDSSGRLLVGHTSPTSVGVGAAYNMPLQVIGTSYDTAGIVAARYAANSFGPTLHFVKSRNATKGSQTIVQDDDTLGFIRWYGSDGTDTTNAAAMISAEVDATPASDKIPGRLSFWTTDDLTYPRERLRITSGGQLIAGGASSADSSALINIIKDTTEVLADNEPLYNNASPAFLTVYNSNNTGSGEEAGINIVPAGNANGAISIYGKKTGSYAGDLIFRFRSGASTSAERLRIKSTGEVHISDRNSANAGEHILQGGSFGIRMQDTGGYNRWNIERNYGGWQSTPLIHLSAQGRVGINENLPERDLHISNTTPYIRVESGAANQPATLELYHTRGNGSDKWPVSVSTDDAALTFNVANAANGSPVEKLRITNAGFVTINSSSYEALKITTTENGNNGPEVQLIHNSASPAANDCVGQLRFSGKDSAGNTDLMSRIETIIDDPTSGQETAHLNFATRGYAAFNTIFRLKARSTASAPSYTTDDMNGIILDTYNTGNPYPRYFNFIAKSAGNTDSNITFWTEEVGGSPTKKLTIQADGNIVATNSIKSDNLSGRNILINGDMRIKQRLVGTSNVTGITSNGYHALDRWYVNLNGPTIRIERDSDNPGHGFEYSMAVTTTTPSGSLAAGNTIKIGYNVEGYDIARLGYGDANAKSFTLSFWVKSSLTGVFAVTFTRDSKLVNRQVTVSSANSWEFKSVTIAGDTAAAFGNVTTSNGMSIGICPSAGSNSTGGSSIPTWSSFHNAHTAYGANMGHVTTNGAVFKITGAQLEIGEVVTPFEFKPYDQELTRCKRYYQDWRDYQTFANKTADSTYDGHVVLGSFELNMRANPTVTRQVYGRIAGGSGWTDGSNNEAAGIHHDPSATYPGRWFLLTGTWNWHSGYNDTIAVKFHRCTFDAEI